MATDESAVGSWRITWLLAYLSNNAAPFVGFLRVYVSCKEQDPNVYEATAPLTTPKDTVPFHTPVIVEKRSGKCEECTTR